MEERSILAQRLGQARSEKGLSRERLAKMIYAHGQSVYYWETDKRNPSSENLARLATVLDVSADWLLGLV